MEFQNPVQIRAMAEQAATQIRIQKTVESFSAIAISYYLVGLLKSAIEAVGHAGFEVFPVVTLLLIPVVIGAVALTLVRLKRTVDVAGDRCES